MKKLFTLIAENGDKLKIRVERNDDLSWSIDEIAPAFGCKPDVETRPESYLIQKTLYEKLSDLSAFMETMRFWGQMSSNEEAMSSKNKLPKTKAEFREFYKLFTGTSHDITMADFLEDYEE